MSRAREAILLITGDLVVSTPLHVGGYGDDPETDMPLARNGCGDIYVPGTSVAGPLRAWVEQRFSPELARAMFGFQEGEKGAASFILIDDAVVKGDVLSEVWDGVGIDREYGSAAAAVKFDRAVLPKSTRLRLSIEIEIAGTGTERYRATLAHMLRALATGEIVFGAATTRGLGRLQLDLDSLQLVEEDWSQPSGVLAVLFDSPRVSRGNDAIRKLLGQSQEQPRSSTTLEVTIDWETDGPLMVKGPFDGFAVDTLPFVSSVGPNEVALTLPGSAIKGTLRAHAERIVRTLRDLEPSEEWAAIRDPRRRHMAQIDGLPLVDEIFGTRRRSDATQPRGPSQTVVPGKGALSVDTCYARNTLARDAWQAFANARSDQGEDRLGRSPLYESLHDKGFLRDESAATPYFEQAHHVAVDRWTGGAAANLLFSDLEPRCFTWEPIKLRIYLRRLPPDRIDACLALLLVVLRDFDAGRIALGYGTNRGYGSVKAKQILLECAAPAFAWLNGHTLAEVFAAPELAALQTAWADWIGKENAA